MSAYYPNEIITNEIICVYITQLIVNAFSLALHSLSLTHTPTSTHKIKALKKKKKKIKAKTKIKLLFSESLFSLSFVYGNRWYGSGTYIKLSEEENVFINHSMKLTRHPTRIEPG